MIYDSLPQHVLAKLLALNQPVEALSARADAIQRGIDDRRARLWGTSVAPTTTPAPSKRSSKGSWSTRRWCNSGCKPSSRFCPRARLGWDRLPAGTKLEPVAITTDGHDLAEIRKRIKAAIAELDALKRAPAPSSDIEARVRDYVRRFAPKVQGVGVGERLSIVWPGAQSSSGYISEHTCDPLALLAALFPDRMLTLVMGEVERMANDPLPVAQRAPRVAALERELDELHRVEEVLVADAIAAGHPVHRSPSAPPAAVLGVRVADRASRAA